MVLYRSTAGLAIKIGTCALHETFKAERRKRSVKDSPHLGAATLCVSLQRECIELYISLFRYPAGLTSTD